MRSIRALGDFKGMTSPHRSFWAIGAILFVWFAMGCMNVLSQLSAAQVAEMPESYRAVIEARPGWATAAFFIAVFSGAIGSIVLLARRAFAKILYSISAFATLAVVVSLVPFGFGPATLATVLSWAVSMGSVFYARYAQSKGWIG